MWKRSDFPRSAVTIAVVTPGGVSGCGEAVRGLPVHSVRISAVSLRDRRIEVLQVAFEVDRLRSVAVGLQAIEDRHARIA